MFGKTQQLVFFVKCTALYFVVKGSHAVVVMVVCL